jgi:hypothetical protein
MTRSDVALLVGRRQCDLDWLVEQVFLRPGGTRRMTATDERQWTGNVPATRFIGQELLRLRLEEGISLRRLARLFGMSAHSGLVDYERGARIPPSNIVAAYGKVFPADREYLLRLHRAAMVERAAELIAARA